MLDRLKDEVKIPPKDNTFLYSLMGQRLTTRGAPNSGQFPNYLYGNCESLCTYIEQKDQINDNDNNVSQVVPEKLFVETKLKYEIPKINVDGENLMSSRSLCKESHKAFSNWKNYSKFPSVEGQRFLVCGLPGNFLGKL